MSDQQGRDVTQLYQRLGLKPGSYQEVRQEEGAREDAHGRWPLLRDLCEQVRKAVAEPRPAQTTDAHAQVTPPQSAPEPQPVKRPVIEMPIIDEPPAAEPEPPSVQEEAEDVAAAVSAQPAETPPASAGESLLSRLEHLYGKTRSSVTSAQTARAADRAEESSAMSAEPVETPAAAEPSPEPLPSVTPPEPSFMSPRMESRVEPRIDRVEPVDVPVPTDAKADDKTDDVEKNLLSNFQGGSLLDSHLREISDQSEQAQTPAPVRPSVQQVQPSVVKDEQPVTSSLSDARLLSDVFNRLKGEQTDEDSKEADEPGSEAGGSSDNDGLLGTFSRLSKS